MIVLKFVKNYFMRNKIKSLVEATHKVTPAISLSPKASSTSSINSSKAWVVDCAKTELLLRKQCVCLKEFNESCAESRLGPGMYEMGLTLYCFTGSGECVNGWPTHVSWLEDNDCM